MHDFSPNELYALAWEKPILAQVELTGNCNQHCLFCFSGHATKKATPNLSVKQWQLIFCKLADLGLRTLDFTGSECFLYPELNDLLARATEMGFTVRIDTNGTFDISETAPLLKEISFSVHGIGDVHEQITGRLNSFSILEKNIALAISHGINVHLNMTLVKSNYFQLLEVFEYFSKYSKTFSFSPFMAIPSRFGNDFEEHLLVMTKALLGDYINRLHQIPADRLVLKHGFHSIYINEPQHYTSSALLLPNCAAGKYKMVVDFDGSVYPCNFFKGSDFFCGNLLTEDVQEIWSKGKGFQPFRSLIFEEKIPGECNICLKKKRCFSGCRAWAKKYPIGGFDYDQDIRCAFGNAFIRG